MLLQGIPNNKLVAHWINERWKRFQGKETGVEYISPDYRMNQHRFCNVHRENDKVTRALRASWMKPEDNQDDLPFIAVMARRFNKVASFIHLERPTEFSTEVLYPIFKAATVNNNGNTLVNTAAYRVGGLMSAYGGAPDGARTHAWALANLTAQTWEVWKELKLTRKTTLEETHKDLMLLPGVGSFMSAQAVADLKHTQYLKDAPDWWTWAAIGPGSQRGLNRYFTGDLKGPVNPKNFLGYLHQMEDEVSPFVSKDIPRIGSQDWQNVMCEFDKYLRKYEVPTTGKEYRSR
jgi:hypothetical protein